MTEWGVFLVVSAIVAFVISIVTVCIKVSNIIQKNTDSNDALKEALGDLKTTLNTLIKDNKAEHKAFQQSINTINRDIAVLQTKHDADIHRLEEHNE